MGQSCHTPSTTLQRIPLLRDLKSSSTAHSYRRVRRSFRLPWKLLGSLLSFFMSVVFVTTRNMVNPTPRHNSWNKTVEELFPYLRHEEDADGIANIFNQNEEVVIKERDLNIEDVLKKSPIARRGKQKIGQVDIQEEVEKDIYPWPLSPLQGCPEEGVLTVESGGHLGTLMTQFSILYALSRRDGKHAYLPPSLEMPLKQMFRDVSFNSLSQLTACNVQFNSLGLDDYERIKKKDPTEFRKLSFEIKRGPNRAKLYHRYRDDLIRNFEPQSKVSSKTNQILSEYLNTKTRPGEARVVIGIYLEAEDFEYMKKLKKKDNSMYVIDAIKHFRGKYNKPIFLIRCSNYVWCLQRFKKSLEAGILDKSKKEKLVDLKIFFPDKGMVWKYVDDFSLITKSNHSIVLRSHFAWWMSYCSTGYSVIPNMDGSILGNVKSVKLPWVTVEF